MSIYTPQRNAPAPTRNAGPNLPATAFPRLPVPAPAAAPSRRAQLTREGWTSPRVLQALLLAALLGSVLLFAAGSVAYAQLRDAAQSVGRDSVPTVLAALQIQASLVDMDANAANDLLAGANGSRTARDSFEAQRSIIGRQIARAAQNVSYGNIERVPIDTLQDGMTQYTQQIAQARAQLRATPNDSGPALATYRQASDFLQSTLVPAAQRLQTVNAAALDRAYSDAGTASNLATALMLLAGAALLAVLIVAQLYLSRRTRRTLNPALLVASLALAAFLVNALGTVGAQREALREANRESFASLSNLWGARAQAYAANGDQTLFLLFTDGASRMRYQSGFNERVADIDRRIAAELRGVETADEGSAARAAQTEFNGYRQSDARIRMLDAMGMRDQALALATGTNVDQSRRSFERFDIALTRGININQTGFDAAVNRAFAAVEPLQWLAPAVALGVALLAFAGLQPRMREYAV